MSAAMDDLLEAASPAHSPALEDQDEVGAAAPGGMKIAPAAEADGLASPPPAQQQQQLEAQPVEPSPAAAAMDVSSNAASPSHAIEAGAPSPIPSPHLSQPAAVRSRASSLAGSAPPPPASASSPIAPAPRPVSPLPPLELPSMRDLPPIKLGKSAKERQWYEQLGDLYSLIVTTEHLETAYVRDAISEQAYTSACLKLIAQYKTLREAMGEQAPELGAFCRDYSLQCRAAEQRLKVGIPATVLHGEAGAGGAGGAGAASGVQRMEVSVFHAVQHFITLMDGLKLGQRAVDELHPPLMELAESISKVPALPQDHESRTKTLHWLTTLHAMRAHEELTDAQCRQFSFDLDQAYNQFHKFVKGH